MSDDIIKLGDINKKLELERDEYKRRCQDWERWAKQMVHHFRRVPLDTATVGMRNTLTQWMQEMEDRELERNKLKEQLEDWADAVKHVEAEHPDATAEEVLNALVESGLLDQACVLAEIKKQLQA